MTAWASGDISAKTNPNLKTERISPHNRVRIRARQIYQNFQFVMDNYFFYVNNYTPTSRAVDLYQSKNHLLKDMMDTMRKGGKHYVACNSKSEAENIAEMSRVDTGLRVMCITSANSQDPEIKDFINNIVERIRDYDVLVASPSLGTGIDITFPDQEQWIDYVWGIFSDKINTHFDMDQQLCRVRHPRHVKAWVAESSLQYETEPSAIKRVVIDLDELPEAIRAYGPYGMPVIDDDDPLLHVYAHAVSMQNASKNDLRGNFIKLKERNGWEVKHIAPPKPGRGSSDGAGSNIGMQAAEARKRLEEMYAADVCDAEPLTEEEYQALNDAMVLTSDEQLRRDRYAIEKFYGQKITPELVLMDNQRREIVGVLGFVHARTIPATLRAVQQGSSFAAKKLSSIDAAQHARLWNCVRLAASKPRTSRYPFERASDSHVQICPRPVDAYRIPFSQWNVVMFDTTHQEDKKAARGMEWRNFEFTTSSCCQMTKRHAR
ncbi:hypothetical protein LMA00_04125 [Burkholderia ambifaria]|uniref:hypothetical protein n=1 Tax=Burkholderia ambifaria TaxID=152480 RepID=UPI001E464EA5|nr:hypothetical protein [Burkholderia ambifaria]UEP48962.1 hypothetical protein LMA00_04125 [Burkholderia ambifaria]